jgi:hypothetical protein
MNEASESRRGLVVAATAEGTLSGRIVRVSIEDARPSLAFTLRIPVIVSGTTATLLIELRYPEVRSWQGLAGRTYRFDESTRTYEKSDGQTYARDDVFGDIRTSTGYYDTFITLVAFENENGEHLNLRIEGTVRIDRELEPFSVDAQVRVGGVVVEQGGEGDGVRLLDGAAYQPAVTRDGVITYDPKFQ